MGRWEICDHVGSLYKWRWAYGAGIQGPEAKAGVGRVLVWRGLQFIGSVYVKQV